MKVFILSFTFLIFAFQAYSQTNQVNWENVQIYEFTSNLNYPDSLEICGGEWMVKGKATSLSELNASEQKRIKKTVAKYGCTIVYVCTQQVFQKGKLYILGLKSKGEE